MKEIMATWKI